MSITITAERPDSPEASALVMELDELLIPLYPAESHHGLDVRSLIAEGVAFFVLRVDGAPAGCGGVKRYGAEYGEIKRMFVRPQFRGRGLSKLMLGHLEAYTRDQGVPILRLETGVLQHEAIALYERMGYVEVGPFGDYQPDPHSCFYEKRLP
ncbi:GNAT family N-acetyltransferase [Chloroflexales bacterium ZM16-3]|nr:GNAT family N-acetyltransferase [Chloroflexales bacterium ZM16-3]